MTNLALETAKEFSRIPYTFLRGIADPILAIPTYVRNMAERKSPWGYGLPSVLSISITFSLLCASAEYNEPKEIQALRELGSTPEFIYGALTTNVISGLYEAYRKVKNKRQQEIQTLEQHLD